jgi:hypothetical protein
MYSTAQEIVQLLSHAATVLLTVNANRFLPKFPTNSFCHQSDKQLRTEL